MHCDGHRERVFFAVGVVRVRAERKQSSNRLGQFRALPRLRHGEVKQRRAVTSGRLQIRKRLCCRADCVLIVSYDGLRDSKQRRLIAKGWRGHPRHSKAHEKGYRSGQAAAQTVLRLGWRAQGFRGAHRPRRRKNIRSSLSPKGHGASAPKRFITIGRYGALTVDEARNRAKEILGAVATGEDPAADLALRRAASTFKEIADLFLREHVGPKRKLSTAQDYESLLTTYAIPALGNRKAEAVTRAEVARLHGQIGDRPYQANRLLAVIGSLYTFAERRGLVPESCNPTRRSKNSPRTVESAF